MGREFIGECLVLQRFPFYADHEVELTIKYIKQASGKAPRGVDVQITWEDHELGSYPVISVVWDDYTIEYPHEYIGKCITALESLISPKKSIKNGGRGCACFVTYRMGSKSCSTPIDRLAR